MSGSRSLLLQQDWTIILLTYQMNPPADPKADRLLASEMAQKEPDKLPPRDRTEIEVSGGNREEYIDYFF